MADNVNVMARGMLWGQLLVNLDVAKNALKVTWASSLLSPQTEEMLRKVFEDLCRVDALAWEEYERDARKSRGARV